MIGKGEPIYRVERKILETDEFFDDGSHILYVNGAYRGDSDIGKLMHDFPVPMRMICFMENWQTESDTSRKMRKELRVCAKQLKK